MNFQQSSVSNKQFSAQQFHEFPLYGFSSLQNYDFQFQKF